MPRVVFFILFPYCVFCQFSIEGIITDKKLNPIPFAQIYVETTNLKVVKYTFSDKFGKYTLEVPSLEFIIICSALGYEKQKIELDKFQKKRTILINFNLDTSVIKLNEVIVSDKKPITVQKDTIKIQTKHFTNGSEKNVEELLSKIPGIEVNDGVIKVAGKAIQKILVDGDDLFGGGYAILSKNMPAYPIEEVEILKNYSNNRLLQEIEQSSRIVLNLNLNEKAKRIWFGNVEANIGNDNFYHFKGNLMNFGKKNKYFFLADLNSVGYDATGDIENLVRPFSMNEPSSIGDNQSTNSLINLSPNSLDFKKSRFNFNNAEMVALNAIFNPNKKIKIKTLGFFNWDEINFFRNRIDIVNTNKVSFTNTEDYQLRNSKRVAFGKLNFSYDISENEILESITKYNYGDFDDSSNLVFNNNFTNEALSYQNNLFDQKINYTNKFKDKKVFLITGRIIDEKTPQIYNVNQFFFQDLFPRAINSDNVSQFSQNKMQFNGISAHLLDRKKNGNLLELELGNEYRKDILTTTFSLLKGSIVLEKPEGYQNQISYQVDDLYFKTKYSLKIKDVNVFGKLDFHQLFNKLKNKENNTSQSSLLINPSFGFDWKINDNNTINSSYSYNSTNAEIIDVYSDFLLTGYRSFSKGIGSFNQLNVSSLLFNYQLGNWSNRFFANTYVIFNKNHDFFSTNSIVDQNFTQSEKIKIKDREFININSQLNYYWKFITSNLKVKIAYTHSEYKNAVNNSNLRQVIFNNYSYGLELHSGFKGFFNYSIGSKWQTTEIETIMNNSYEDNVSFLNFSFVLNDKFDLEIQSQRYFFGNLETNNTYYFLDFDTRYELKKDKLTLSLTGSNLFNTKRFRNFSVSDIGTSSTEYRLLPRFLLIKLEYRF